MAVRSAAPNRPNSDDALSRRDASLAVGTLGLGALLNACLAPADDAATQSEPLKNGKPPSQTVSVDASSGAIAAGVALTSVNGKAAVLTNYATQRFVGVALSSATYPGDVLIQTQGFASTKLVSLGVGASSLVGTDNTGKPVRVADAACASGSNVLGWCDESGALFISPSTYASGAITVDIVLDGGADLTGQQDCGSALSTCLSLLMTWNNSTLSGPKGPIRDLTLNFPAGRFAFTNAATVGATWNFVNSGSVVRIRGQRGATLIELRGNGLGGNYVFGVLANMTTLVIEDLTFFSAVTSYSPQTDCGGICEMNPQRRTVVRGVYCINISSSGPLFYSFGNAVRFSEITIAACECTSDKYGMLYTNGPYLVEFDNVDIIDIGTLNGWLDPGRIGYNTNSIKVDGPCASVLIRNVFIDEACQCNINLDGSGGPIETAEIVGIFVNQPALPPRRAGLLATNVKSLHVRGMKGMTDGGAPYVVLESVARAELDMLEPHTAILAQYVVVADSSCGQVTIRDLQGFGVERVSSLASRTTFEHIAELGSIETGLYRTGQSVSAYQLVKITSAGVVALGVNDPATAAIGVAYDTVGGTANVRVARRGQRVTVTSDGVSAIAIGDQLSTSTTISGAVTPGVGNVVGIALSAADPIVNATLNMLLL